MPAILPLIPNKLAYPGGRPGFNPRHVAAKSGLVRCSAVCSSIANGGNFFNLLPPVKVSTQGVNPPSATMDAYLGPAINDPTTGGNRYYTLSGMPANADLTTFTMAGIVRFYGQGATSGRILCSATNSFGWMLGAYSSGNFIAFGRTNAFGECPSSNVTPATLGHAPAFVVATCQGVSPAKIIFVVRRLDTGQVFTDIVPGPSGGASTPDGTYIIANDNSFIQGCNTIAAVMASGAAMTLPEMLQWAEDPWAFWYG